MKLSHLLPICLMFISACNSQPEKNSTVLGIAQFESRVDSLVQAYVDLDIFSGVVLVADHGEAVYHKAFGLANREKNIPNTVDSRFDIGSMNKAFTKVAVLQLVSEGKLALDDKLGKFVEGFPQEVAEKVTVGMLLEHRSGLPGYHIPAYWDLPYEEKGIDKAIEVVQQQPLEFEPGTEQSYSNSGYVVLGKIIEAVTGKSYYEVIKERITDPLGMKNTYLTRKYDVPNRATGYYKTMKGELKNNDHFMEKPKPDGGFYSTTEDMLHFFREYHYGTKLWDKETRQLDERHAFYQEHMNSGGAMVHAGGFEGSNTVHYEILRDQVSVIIFANADEVVAENLGAGILAIIRGQQPEQPSLPAVQAVYSAYTSHGEGYIRENWESLTRNFHPQDPKDMILNQIGYTLLEEGETDKAVEVFQLNTRLFPEVANVWDSYGEGLRAQGNIEESIEAYKKALEIRPGLRTALQAIEEME
ncbi:serine hydrolase [Zeaxanthinibacter enoshimensis]|uniref:Tetratricopeptide repeat protein n=1 Tax=Zeaxanthinibacter enoshimensis TaxID=392009 RepID=A0A4R6TW16_9FLAO|nr:serine hydrolase [Zeaxanthinibacter enoshimensis]TDQ33138.1 tetratricopeptide repeat protein [Zeaxanthinibacter enoshimensis]